MAKQMGGTETYEAERDSSNELNRSTVPARTGFGSRAKRHCARYWWLHLLIVIVITLGTTLPLVYAVYPAVAQRDLNNAWLEITSQEISNPKAKSFHMNQIAVSHSGSVYHPQLDPFSAALFLEDTLPDIKPFIHLNIPQTHATAEATIPVDQDVDIDDLDQFAAYNKLVLNSEEFRVAIRGRVGINEMKFPKTTADFNKVVTMKGLNGLKGFNVTSLEIKLTPEADGANMLGTVSIPNPSVLTIHMGDVTMNLSVKGAPIGTSLLPNLVLAPGTHEYTMRSTTNQSMVLGLIAKVYRNGILPLDIVGDSSVANGEHLTYYEAAIRENHQRVDLNVGPALRAVGLNITSA